MAKRTVGRRGRVRLAAPKLGKLEAGSPYSVERQVYRLLRRGMMSGLLAPGSSLTGRSIAESLGISPSPVRDALKRLEADGVIESRNKSAYFVGALSRERYIDIMNLRVQIERFAAAKAAEVARPEDIRRLSDINRRYAATTDIAEALRINYLFHFEIYKLANSSILIDVVENLWMRIGPVMHLHMQDYGIGEVTDNHRQLISAIKARNPRGAARALEQDLREAAKIIAPKLSLNGSTSAVPALVSILEIQQG
jgi:GntR family colanic acid and biofilm gene transcriptional regulator